MKQIGIIGWRGMVGSVLLDRMREERDFEHVAPTFFSTSQAGEPAPRWTCAAAPAGAAKVQDANDLSPRWPGCRCSSAPRAAITPRTFIRACEPPVGRATGSTPRPACACKRMPSSCSIPSTLPVMQAARERGIKDFIGGNCTVSLMLMAVGGLMRAGVVEWITAMTYQSASGAGAQNMRELLEQMGVVHGAAAAAAAEPRIAGILDIDRAVSGALAAAHFPEANSACRWQPALIPWIDKDLGNGQSREEWKAGAEANKIHGIRSRPGAGGRHLRAGERHALPLAGADHQTEAGCAARGNRTRDRRPPIRGCAWCPTIANPRFAKLSPGGGQRHHEHSHRPPAQIAMGGEYLSAFTVGDQLLWGAAEPLRRTMRFLLPHV
jgi:aspartate-semialdehyde dehydrogenase